MSDIDLKLYRSAMARISRMPSSMEQGISSMAVLSMLAEDCETRGFSFHQAQQHFEKADPQCVGYTASHFLRSVNGKVYRRSAAKELG